MHAVARLALHPHLTSIQASWVKMGRSAAACLQAGANDLGGTLMNESISRAAGSVHGEEMPPEAMEGSSVPSGESRASAVRCMARSCRAHFARSFGAPPLCRNRDSGATLRAGDALVEAKGWIAAIIRSDGLNAETLRHTEMS